ncbi:MAG TPA: HDIG domain-containing protein, partial [Anaeromyxobacteraceae bacterium]|nr:HDIG domain-containing protein [Anaeromyxobacteraceae bacterium]
LAAGLAAAVAGAALAVAVALHAGTPPGELAVAAGAAVLGGLVLVPVLTAIVLPLVEGLLGYVTDARLRRLANLNHPGLKELIVQAPGTYHHAIVMGALVEPAARAIGADALLARVGAYYHDIGKIKNPLLFSENQRGPNEHDDLTPGMSALIVRRHVADGLEVARAWRLPRSVSELIAQHHGTRLVGYFWAKQQKAAEAGGPAADEAVFRYPGPLPRSREAALVMIADACEASSRALHAPTPEQLRALVDKRIAEIAEEGQLEECDLTLRDLSAVAAAMVGALEGIYHTHAAPPPGRPPEGRPPVQLVGRP